MTHEEAINDLNVIKEFFEQESGAYPVSLEYVIGVLKSGQSADRPQGEWIVADEDGWANGTHALICSECGEGYHLNFERVIGDWNYCPNCGARMKGADDERGR